MFELTINGKTKVFETAAEMAEWKERMSKPPRRKKFKNKKKKPKVTKGLSDRI
jgi:hypothetical protein